MVINRQVIVLGRIVTHGPGGEIHQGLWVAHVEFAHVPAINTINIVAAWTYMIAQRAAIAVAIAGDAVNQHEHIDEAIGANLIVQFFFNTFNQARIGAAQIGVAIHIEHGRPRIGRRRWGWRRWSWRWCWRWVDRQRRAGWHHLDVDVVFLGAASVAVIGGDHDIVVAALLDWAAQEGIGRILVIVILTYHLLVDVVDLDHGIQRRPVNAGVNVDYGGITRRGVKAIVVSI